MASLVRVSRTISQPADADDFMVDLPSPQVDDNYGVFTTQVSGVTVHAVKLPDSAPGDRTTTQFRVVTTSSPPDGAVFEFLVVHP